MLVQVAVPHFADLFVFVSPLNIDVSAPFPIEVLQTRIEQQGAKRSIVFEEQQPKYAKSQQNREKYGFGVVHLQVLPLEYLAFAFQLSEEGNFITVEAFVVNGCVFLTTPASCDTLISIRQLNFYLFFHKFQFSIKYYN